MDDGRWKVEDARVDDCLFLFDSSSSHDEPGGTPCCALHALMIIYIFPCIYT